MTAIDEYFNAEVGAPVPELKTAIEAYAAACPNTPIVLHGYSEGGVVTMETLCGASLWGLSIGPLSSDLFKKQYIKE